MEQTETKSLPKIWLILIIVGSVLLVAAGSVGLYFGLSKNCLYQIVDQGQTQTIRTFSRNGGRILRKCNVTLGPYDAYEEERTENGTVITVLRAQEVIINVEHRARIVHSLGETVGSLLQRYEIGTADPWRVSEELTAMTYDGMKIQVDRVEEKPHTQIDETPFEIWFCNDPSLPEGEEEILVSGIPGKVENIGQAVYVNGEPESFAVSESTVISEPVNQVVAVGTGEKVGEHRRFPLVGENFLFTSEGQCLRFSRVETFQATAYTAGEPGVDYTTACGTLARVGAVAVDPKVIPYFTQMYIVSENGVYDYGVSSAEDCGGAIKGNIIDLYFDTRYECQRFGRRNILVYFLEEEPEEEPVEETAEQTVEEPGESG